MAARSLPDGDDAGGGDGIVAEINITPLTDIFLVLLIIFMVTTSVISSQGKNVDLPSSAVSDATPSGVSVRVTAAGEIQVYDQTVTSEQLPAVLKAKLETVLKIREFASRELGLPDNESYRRYADVGRPFVLWNVFAAREFSVHPERWCFPMVGCVTYRGYFSKAEAERYAGELRAQGHDVYVGGVPAYSTLGWFPDPVLNTFIDYPRGELARLVFHELAHRVIYVPGDTMFNESFATAVELAGVERWIKTNGTPEQAQAFQVAQARKQQFLDLTGRTRERLRRLYLSDLPEQARRAGKAEALRAMREEYDALKQSWGGFAGYDRWFDEPLNNAKLVSIAA